MRLIDADAHILNIAVYMAENSYLNDTPLGVLKMLAKWAEEAPTIDAVPVVRCKECLNAMKIPKAKKKYFANGCLCCALGRGDPTLGISVVMPDDYCSAGCTCVATH